MIAGKPILKIVRTIKSNFIKHMNKHLCMWLRK
jgi:hypothetical protein